MKTFKEYSLSEKTQRFIDLNHYITPTAIQQEVLPLALKNRDVVAISNTGTGKTHAFLIPIMEKVKSSLDEVQAVITAPTRELAMQIHRFAKVMSEADPNLRIKCVVGGKQRETFTQQPHIVIGTPGRIKDYFVEQSLLRLDTARIFIVDEADMTLEYGFLDDVDAICGRMGKKLQMMVFSATVPESLRPFLRKYMYDPQLVQVHTKQANPNIEHILVPCRHKSFSDVIVPMLEGLNPYTCLIFANTREEAGKIAESLRQHEIGCVEIHGGLSSRQRTQALKQLVNHQHHYVVATDIAARGLDIEGVSHVISCGFPSELDFYIHRAGRTGRAGQSGVCYALYHASDDQAIRTLMKRGLHFEHRQYKDNKWRSLNSYGQTYIPKNDLQEKEIAKILHRKNEKVKPSYKKKRAAEIQKIKQKQRRDAIRSKVKAQRKEMFKKQQAEKGQRG